ncbi:hypothetical protein BGP77_00200 [Saccharospirillum sp. MSK14-1]|uniref:tRNA-queuosine alpha-mannosyltransferase domain-containing protein n=1 Tax=Saccharospirillum sp. MSK14-1 TaxID=1897632 RepID=UPI000D39F361|nr:DUF3524 domain-containing protein [Saccharospirillum sp. MSK14-1]PTY35790.1 hypothetical protein BGP77_00200 [Saccharospirillum sp. MSK14-1]
MNILLLSAYHSASHRYWCDGMMAAFPEHNWTLRSQPARHFSWRIEASGWLWALSDDAAFQQHYDLIIATSLTQVVTLKAQCPALRDVPLWLYFHENQFAHPLSNQQQAAHQTAWQFKSLENAFCADWVSFNTRFNRDTFFNGARKLLKKLPEPLPGDPLMKLEQQSAVLPVPLTDRFLPLRAQPKDPALIVWNHRWEWDKQPQRLLNTLLALAREGVEFRLAMLGSGGGRGEAFAKERAALGERIVHWGEASAADYEDWLGRAGIGVSTALHDFQGLAMLELAQAGATCIVPKRQAYPECLPEAVFYNGQADDASADTAELVAKLRDCLGRSFTPQPIPPSWARLKADYRRVMERLTQG